LGKVIRGRDHGISTCAKASVDENGITGSSGGIRLLRDHGITGSDIIEWLSGYVETHNCVSWWSK